VIRQSYALAGSLAAGLAAPVVLRFSLTSALVVAVCAAALSPRLSLACLLALAGWWWGTARLHELDASELAGLAGSGGIAIVDVKEPPRIGSFDVRETVVVRRWDDRPLHESVLLELARTRAPPPQGARLRVIGTIRVPPDYERAWLRRHGVHVVLRASTVQVLRRRGGVADRLHAWLAGASVPGVTGERRAVIEGVVLGEDGGLSDGLKQRFRASGLYHLLAVSGGNVAVVAAGTVGIAFLLGVSRIGAELAALVAISGYVLAVGPQPSVIRAGVVGALGSLAWLSGRERDRWYALLVAAIALLAWNPYSSLDPGFQLSFGAVLAIFTLAPRIERRLEGYPVPRLLARCIAISAACGLVTAPISWFHFHAIPLVTVPANLAAAPVVTPLLALALLAAVLPPAGPLLAQVNGWCAAYLAGCARFFGGLPGAQIRSPAAAAVLAAGFACTAAYAWRRGERAQAGLSPARKRPAEDRPRGAPAA
jgi:ComEC/Rec2-related protein